MIKCELNEFPMRKDSRYKIVTICAQTGSELDVLSIDKSLEELINRHYDIEVAHLNSCDGYSLDNFTNFCNLYGISIDTKICKAILFPRHFTDDLSYRIHTNAEARMMLEQNKPLAVFSRHVNEEISLPELLGYQNFEPVKPIRENWRFNNIEYFFYANHNEVWRIQAYKLIIKATYELGHCEQIEWIEGILLGYTEKQNKEFLGMN